MLGGVERVGTATGRPNRFRPVIRIDQNVSSFRSSKLDYPFGGKSDSSISFVRTDQIFARSVAASVRDYSTANLALGPNIQSFAHMLFKS